jgi:hypothetical protein
MHSGEHDNCCLTQHILNQMKATCDTTALVLLASRPALMLLPDLGVSGAVRVDVHGGQVIWPAVVSNDAWHVYELLTGTIVERILN